MSDTTKIIQQAISQTDAAKRYGLSERTIRRWEKARLVKGKRVLGVKLYPLKEIDALAGLRK